MKHDDRELGKLIASGIALIPEDETLSSIEASNCIISRLGQPILLGTMDVAIVTIKGVESEKTYVVCDGPELVLQSEVRLVR